MSKTKNPYAQYAIREFIVQNFGNLPLFIRIDRQGNEELFKFGSFDVLEDPDIREGIKSYGNWPTIPQLYIDKKLVGGSDILMEMYEAGELQEMVKG